MPDEIKAVYKRVYLSPSPVKFKSPWEFTVYLISIDTACAVRFVSIDDGSQGKIGPGGMDAKVRFELQLSTPIQVEGLRRENDSEEDETEAKYTFDNELEVYNDIRHQLAPIADLVCALICGKISHVFIQDYPHISVHFIYENDKWGYTSI